MSRFRAKAFWRDQTGATAALYALALPALVAVGGVGFDYARLAGMDSELQNAADQAALAAATQLDGKTTVGTTPGACQRAANAAKTLVSNTTLLSNDGKGQSITWSDAESSCDQDGIIRFWKTVDSAGNGVLPATTDADAKYVEIVLFPDGPNYEALRRRANYVLTPIVGALYGEIVSAATAGVGSSICKVPPVMICNPVETTDPNFTIGNYIGKGVRLVANDGGGNYAPGNFGYLETNAGNGAQATAETLGRRDVPGDCIAADGVTTKPGEQLSVLDALNTRFDVYANGINNACGNGKSLCPPSANARKDVMLDSNGKWEEAPNPYRPTSVAPLTAAVIATLSPMGYPRDICHAVSKEGSCLGGRIGDGVWDRSAYFASNSVNYSTVPPTSSDMISMFGTDTPTRYQVYKYEAANRLTRLKPQTHGGMTAWGEPTPDHTVGVPVGGASPDRRVLSVAVINCTAEGVGGRTEDVDVVRWIDVFLVEPALKRGQGNATVTEQSDVYVEVIGQTSLGGGGTSGQSIRRDVPYLVR